ncbi:MAG: DnaJ domain-containing protein [Deltaproteobacteria bacterium]|nr:DnaJ domain-containing protein [Deltaproteobacteria bacterium]
MEYIDYYKVLGVGRDASAEEIAKAYRRQARKFHPDVSKEPGAEEQFKRVNEANQVLSDPEKRRRYDLLGSEWRDGEAFRPPPGWADGSRVEFRTYPGGGFAGGGDWSDFFASIFGGSPGGGRGGVRAGVRGGGRGGRGRVSASPFGGGVAGFSGTEQLDPELEDLFGGPGGGARGRARPRRGADIEGELEVPVEEALRGGPRSIQLRGPEGRVRTFEVKIPAGIHDGARIRLAGRGESGRAGAPDGDLLLVVRVVAVPPFRIDGGDLVTAVDVAPWEAALGATVAVPTPDGPVQMKLPAGLSSGGRLRLRGKGLPQRERGRGDLYAEVRIVVPGSLSEKERRLFEELREASTFKPRGE